MLSWTTKGERRIPDDVSDLEVYESVELFLYERNVTNLTGDGQRLKYSYSLWIYLLGRVGDWGFPMLKFYNDGAFRLENRLDGRFLCYELHCRTQLQSSLFLAVLATLLAGLEIGYGPGLLMGAVFLLFFFLQMAIVRIPLARKISKMAKGQ